MSYRYASSRSSGMGGYGSYSNAYGGSGGQTGLSKGAGTGLDPHRAGNLSDEEKITAPASTEESGSTPESGAGEMHKLTTSAHEHVKDLEAKVARLTTHLEDHEHSASPAPKMAHNMQNDINYIKGLLAKLEKKVEAHCATLTAKRDPNGASNSATHSAPYSAPAIAARSMGRAPSAYSSGSYSRYRY